MVPPSLRATVPPGHLEHFVRDTMQEALDLSAIHSRGIYSSRQLDRACQEAITGRRAAEHRSRGISPRETGARRANRWALSEPALCCSSFPLWPRWTGLAMLFLQM